MPDRSHWILPGGTPPSPLPPRLRALLQLLDPADRTEAEAAFPATPCELATARAMGLPQAPGYLPWAALETQTVGQPCAWVWPCHWQVNMNDVVLHDRATLALDAADAEALRLAMAPYFLEDGIVLAAGPPGAWLATGEAFRGLRCISSDCVVGQAVTPQALLPAGPGGALLQRLQNEMQMLLYTHPVNDARAARGLPPVNSVWFGGAGQLDAPHPPRPGVVVEPRIAAAADADRAAAWAAVDASTVADALACAQAGRPLTLTLCGPQAAQDFVTPLASGGLQRLSRRIAQTLQPGRSLQAIGSL